MSGGYVFHRTCSLTDSLFVMVTASILSDVTRSMPDNAGVDGFN